jgi:hypothetical protein
MENMKSLADQLREQLVKPPAKTEKAEKLVKKTKPKEVEYTILEAIRSYDSSLNKSMVHVRFDEKTVRTMNQFKMATSVDVTKLVAFAVKYLFDTCPDLKLIIKQFIQNQDL